MATVKEKKVTPQKRPTGRPRNILKGLSPAELKRTQETLKKIIPDCAQSIADYFAAESGQAKAKAGKEVITLWMALDLHTMKRATEAHALARRLSGKDVDDGDLNDIEDTLKDPDSDGQPVVFKLHVTKNKE